jgi:hypothetical protein
MEISPRLIIAASLLDEVRMEQTSRLNLLLGFDLSLHLLLALKILPHQIGQARTVDGARPPLQTDTFEQAAHVAADPRIDIEIVGARLAGLGELAFQALQLNDQDASSANDVPLSRRRVVDTTHVADRLSEQVLEPTDPKASAIAAGY